MLQWRTEFGVKAQLDALVQGVSCVVPVSALHVFDLQELRMLLNGKPTIDVEELRANTVFQGGYNEHSQVVLWLWQALREFSLELRGLFLKFMMGTNKIPLDGFEPPLNLTKSDLDPQALPRTHTCFNQIVLPEYTSYETTPCPAARTPEPKPTSTVTLAPTPAMTIADASANHRSVPTLAPTMVAPVPTPATTTAAPLTGNTPIQAGTVRPETSLSAFSSKAVVPRISHVNAD